MPPVPAPPTPLDQLLEYLRASRGFDFTGYKRTTLARRVAKRMAQVEVSDHVAYRDYLELHPDEFAQLFNTILINVTGFFRDPPVWEHLAEHTIPELLAGLDEKAPVRVWCAGCSSGEETYTIAMLLAEALGPAAYLARVKIYATDVDDEALAEARAAEYSDKSVEAIPPALLEKYFESRDHRHRFRKNLRRAVIFGRNDLVQDAPISRIDLLSCRNTLMYFNAETQAQILNRLNFALDDGGTLVVGKSEMLITHSDLFVARDLKLRLFGRVRRNGLRDRPGPPAPHAIAAPSKVQDAGVRELAFDAAPAAQIVLDADERIVAVNRQAQSIFGVGPNDVGRPLRDLEISYRPADLRTNLQLVGAENRTIVVGPTTHTTLSGDHVTYDVQIAPLDLDGTVVGTTVTFLDVTLQQHLRAELERSTAELENAYEELQSTVEELETTNEELQSTNEELETTNEELQSTNEELETINDELRVRSRELNEVNGFLETILTATETALVVVDGQLVIQLWNAQAEELFGLRLADVQGRALLGIDAGLPVAQLAEPLHDVLRGTAERRVLELAATNRRGRAVNTRVTVLPLNADADSTYGASLLIEMIDPPDARANE